MSGGQTGASSVEAPRPGPDRPRPGRGWANPFLIIVVLTACAIPQAFLFHQAATDAAGRAGILTDAPAVVRGMAMNTLVAAAVAVTLAVAIGLTSAFLVIRCDLLWRRTLSVLLCLPFAIPPFAYAAVLVGSDAAVRHLIPDGAVGLGIILGLALFPWVYVPAKATLARQGRHYQELAASLGMSPWRRWWAVDLQLLLPTLAVSSLLVMMAVLSDFGTAALLGVKTLSVGVHDAMFSMQRPDWAAQLSAIGLLLPCLAVVLFAIAHGRRAVYQPANRAAPAPLIRLPAWQRWLVSAGLLAILGLSLAIPVGMLAVRAWQALDRLPLMVLLPHLWNTVLVTGCVALITVVVAFVLHLARRDRRRSAWDPLGLLFNLNYAVPGAMLAIALLFLASALPTGITSLVLSDTCILLVVAGVLSHLCFPYAAIGAGMRSLPRETEDLCTVVRLGRFQRAFIVFLPLLRGHIAGGALIVVVLLAQELPLALILQPFDFQTLGLRLYDLARVEVLKPASLYALVIVALLTYPVIALDRIIMGDADAAS